MDKNKIKFGLKNVHVAEVKAANGKITYGIPQPIPGAVSLTLSPDGDKVEFEADDSVYFSESSNNGYTGDLEMAIIPDSFRINHLGDTLDSNGALVENSEAVTKPFALLFEFQGDKNKTRHVMYNCTAARPELSGKTKGKTIDPQTEKLSLSARPALDTKDVKSKVAQDSKAYENFYKSVYLANSQRNTIGNKAITQSKASNLVINDIDGGLENQITRVTMNGNEVYGVHLGISDLKLTIKSEYLNTLENGVYELDVYLLKGNAVTAQVTITD